MTPVSPFAALASTAPASLATPVAEVAGDFGAVLAEAARSGVAALRSAEAGAVAGLAGQGSVQQVVTGVLEAERGLQTAIALRDRVVGALQELGRMQI